MTAEEPGAGRPKLSICIATYNRGTFIGQTLDSIVGQLSAAVELVILDGASPDDTERVVSAYVSSDRPLRYIREKINSGVDADYDKAVGHAQGEYCWLMTDDDLLVPGAVAKVLARLAAGPDVLIVNAEVATKDFSRTVEPRLLAIDSDRVYPGGSESFFTEASSYLSFIGGVVIKRELWLQRNRTDYYGTLFIHMGVLFQSPPLGEAYAIAEPLVRIRYGNAMWTSRGFEIWMFKWPSLIWGFPGYSDSAKARITARHPWKSVLRLVGERGIARYSMDEFRLFLQSQPPDGARLNARLVAQLPGWIANTVSAIYCLLVNRKLRVVFYDLAICKHSTWLSRLAARLRGMA